MWIRHPSLRSTSCCCLISLLLLTLFHHVQGKYPPPHGYIMGHEMCGVVVETGSKVKNFKVGDRVVSPFTTCCGECFYCERKLTCRCEKGALFGSAKLAGAQAEYARVPMADATLFQAPDDLPDELLVLMADIIPTGYFAAKTAYNLMNESEREGAVCVVLGCGPVGLCAITAAQKRFPTVLAIDSVPDRLERAKKHGAKPFNLTDSDLEDQIKAATNGRGADAILEVVGAPDAVQLAIKLARPGGTIASVGVHTKEIAMPGGTLYNKNLRFAFGRCPVRTVFPEALELLREINRTTKVFDSFIDKKVSLEDAPEYYKLFVARKVGKTVFVNKK